MQHGPAEPTADQRADSNGQKRKTHVRALLLSGRQFGDVFVVLGRLRDFAESKNEYREYGSPIAGPERQDQPRERGNQCAENHSSKRRGLSDEGIPKQRKADYYGSVDAQDTLDASIGVNEFVNVAGEGRELLPEDDPVTGEDQEKQHEPRIGEDGEEIFRGDSDGRSGGGALTFWFAKKEQDEEDHGEDTESGDAKNILHTELCMRPIRDNRSDGAADIDHGVVDRISDGAYIFFGSARGGADDA